MATPARKQYLGIKKEHPDAILLFRMGDFFETFDEDAHTISKELEIALTSREMGKGKKIPLAGIPCHAINPYLARLVKKGYKVAICEQTSDPATSKGLVDRKVVRVVTPGTVIEEGILDQKINNYLSSLVINKNEVGFAYIDITTSEFATSQFPTSELEFELARIMPAEILVPRDISPPIPDSTMVTHLDPNSFDFEWTRETLLKHFGVATLGAYGCEQFPLAVKAAGAILGYLHQTQYGSLPQITSLHTYLTSSSMTLDPQTRRNLDLFEGNGQNARKPSLLSVIDTTRTPMGGRLLRRWIGQPLLDIDQIRKRQNAVSWFHTSNLRRAGITKLLDSISDIERLLNRVRGNTASPRDLVSLSSSLEKSPELRVKLQEADDTAEIEWLAVSMLDNQEVVDLIRTAIVENPSVSPGDGKVIREGFSSDLDKIRNSSSSAREYIARLESKERKRTGIKSLKVGYNKVFGYYIEISKSNLSQVPSDYIRRQTLVGGERFITSEMKEYESKVLNAQEHIAEIEKNLFSQICKQLSQSENPIMSAAKTIAEIDVFCSLAEVATRYGYVKPRITNGDLIEIIDGRHPVVEHSLSSGEFVPNNTRLSSSQEQLLLITGPNMSGKSTFIRQSALITLMAQFGSFVPANSATVGIVDKIFTRIGLHDDLSIGQSTFMVEMVETAAILNHATPNSLIVLDEIGRGTSTYDGLAIARSVAEHIHSSPRLGCKTLFATHYHELIQLADFLPRMRNHKATVSEDKGEVIFLRRIVPGGADRSYGIHVARLAGLPSSVVKRAWEVLGDLEKNAHYNTDDRLRTVDTHQHNQLPQQLPLTLKNPASIEKLLDLDVTTMTPLEAMNKLYELQEEARKDTFE